MTITHQKLTFSEYLNYQDNTDNRYELVAGELIPMSLGTGKHGAIAKRLERFFDDEITRLKLPWIAQRFSVGLRSPRGGRWDTSRIPDVTVLPLEQWNSLGDREAVIDLNEEPSLLVVEIVSPSTQVTDYRSKQAEYAVLEIPEYWIVDPLQDCVIVCTLVEGWYDQLIFRDEERLVSPTFFELVLTANQILSG
ncbi:MAG: Uma2 family endonuclease [Snowella sp.]|nr:Uma2 family endonuclease [Snowella sp.]